MSSLKWSRKVNGSTPLWVSGISLKYAVGGASGSSGNEASDPDARVRLTSTASPADQFQSRAPHQ